MDKISKQWVKLRKQHQQLKKLASLEKEIDVLEKNRIFSKSKIAFEIMVLVCEEFHFTIGALVGRARHAEIVIPRHAAMYLVRKFTDLGYAAIGQLFKRDPTTIFYAELHVRDLVETEPKFAERLVRLESVISKNYECQKRK